MNIQQFLAQFHFATMAECRRAVIGNHVKIDGFTIKYEDLSKPISEFAKIGSILQIGKKIRYEITQEDFSKDNILPTLTDTVKDNLATEKLLSALWRNHQDELNRSKW